MNEEEREFAEEVWSNRELRGAVWRWKRWIESAAVLYDAKGEGEAAVWDHDHCRFCNARFSAYEGTLHEGWASPATRSDESGNPPYVPPGYMLEAPIDDGDLWVCGDCFERYRTPLNWTTTAGD
jgi:hypothetical protein